jgi:hypothetical protein
MIHLDFDVVLQGHPPSSTPFDQFGVKSKDWDPGCIL